MSENNKKMKIAISGATGLSGQTLVAVFRELGHHVVPMVRKEQQDGIYWSVPNHAVDAESLEGFDVVILLAGEPIGPAKWTEERKKRIRSSRVDGVELISDALASLEKKPSLLIQASAVGYYGNRGDEWLTEESSNGDGFLADVCAGWEAASKSAEDAGIRVARLRFGHILKENDGILEAMETPIEFFVGGRLGSGKQYWSYLTVEDLARMVAFVIANDELKGAINAVTPHPVTNEEFTRVLAKKLGRPAVVPAPEFALRMAFGKEQAEEMLLSGQRVRPAVLEQHGFDFLFPRIEEALDHVYGDDVVGLVGQVKSILESA